MTDTVFRSPMWPVDNIFVLPAVGPIVTSSCLDTVSVRMGVDRAFAVAGLTAWNSLSDDLLDPTLSNDSFRRLLKTRLFVGY